MNAELYLLGKRIDMTARRRRRWLVVWIYLVLAAMVVGFWFLDHWRVSLFWVYIATNLANGLFLGGNAFGGLIKPFRNKPRDKSLLFSREAPLVGLLRWGYFLAPDPVPVSGSDEEEFLSDERELHQRGLAHFHANRVLTVALTILWLVSIVVLLPSGLSAILCIPAQLFLYGLIVVALVLALTLPQSILLWTEPDMDQEI